jgi:hypothetical protein
MRRVQEIQIPSVRHTLPKEQTLAERNQQINHHIYIFNALIINILKRQRHSSFPEFLNYPDFPISYFEFQIFQFLNHPVVNH